MRRSPVVALLVLPAAVHPDLRDLRLAAAACATREDALQYRPDLPDIIISDTPPCYVLQPGGIWVVEGTRADGTRAVLETVEHPTFIGCSTLGRSVDEPPAVSLAFRCS